MPAQNQTRDAGPRDAGPRDAGLPAGVAVVERPHAGARAHLKSCDRTKVNDVRIRVSAVELYYVNETRTANAAIGIAEQDLFPLDSDRVRLQAIVWARPDAMDYVPAPYVGPQDPIPQTPAEKRRYFRLGYQRADLTPRPYRGGLSNLSRAPDLREWRQQHLPEDQPISRWPAEWPPLQFNWDKLKHVAGGKVNHNRTYRYESELFQRPDGREYAWSVVRRFPAGTHRFRVAAWLLPPHTVAPAGESVTSCPDDSMNRGEALLLPVRRSWVPQPRDNNPRLRELLRWASAFLNVPYEWGGLWFGGSTGRLQGGPETYDGFGVDCTGLVFAVAHLAGLGWNPWARGGVQYAGQVHNRWELQPGDILRSSDHVRIVWEVVRDPFVAVDRNPRITCIEAAGSARRVAFWPRNSLGSMPLSQVSNQWTVRRLRLPSP